MNTHLVIGTPLKHSLSTKLHNYFYKKYGMNASMHKYEDSNLAEIVNYIKKNKIKLAAVTLPFKEDIIPLLDETDKLTQTIGACNTVIYHQNKLRGFNTDYLGLNFAFRNLELCGKSALIIGAGGAAKAIGLLLQHNFATMYWLNRTKFKADAMANTFSGVVIEPEDLIKLNVDIIINTTPIGLYPNTDHSPLENYNFRPHQIIFDMVYRPYKTKLILDAERYGCQCISGLDMFIAQGVKQIELISGLPLEKIYLDDEKNFRMIKGWLLGNVYSNHAGLIPA